MLYIICYSICYVYLSIITPIFLSYLHWYTFYIHLYGKYNNSNTPAQVVSKYHGLPTCFAKSRTDLSKRLSKYIYANWQYEETRDGVIIPTCNFSRTMWQSISICFVRSWNTRFAAIWSVVWLSQYKGVGMLIETLRSRRI